MGRQRKVKIQRRRAEVHARYTKLSLEKEEKAKQEKLSFHQSLWAYGLDTTIQLHYSEKALIDDMWYFQEHPGKISYVRVAHIFERSPYDFVWVFRHYPDEDGEYPYFRVPLSGQKLLSIPILREFHDIIFDEDMVLYYQRDI